jgi:hypothetical protein
MSRVKNECPDTHFFSSHVSPFEKIETVKSHCMNTEYPYPSLKPVDCGSLNRVNPRPRVSPTRHSLKCFLTLIGLQRPNPRRTDGWMDRWIDGLSLHIINIIHVCVFIHVGVCVCVNECIVRDGGGWPSCVITCGIDCWKYLCVPTHIDHLLGGYSLSRRWRAFFFFFNFFYCLLGGYSLSHGWQAVFFPWDQ